MCGTGCCGGYCYEEELSVEDQKLLLDEKEKILEARLATVRHLRDSLKNKSDTKTK